MGDGKNGRWKEKKKKKKREKKNTGLGRIAFLPKTISWLCLIFFPYLFLNWSGKCCLQALSKKKIFFYTMHSVDALLIEVFTLCVHSVFL